MKQLLIEFCIATMCFGLTANKWHDDHLLRKTRKNDPKFYYFKKSDTTNLNLADYYLPNSKSNTTYFSNLKGQDSAGNIIRKIRYKKIAEKKYTIKDQRFLKGNIITEIIYDVVVERNYVIATKITNTSFITNTSKVLNFEQVPDTLLKLTNSEDDYWDMTGIDGSMYECRIKAATIELEGENISALKVRMKEYTNDGKCVRMKDQAILDLYYVKGVGLHSVYIVQQNYFSSSSGWVEDFFPFDLFKKLANEK